MEPIQTEPTSDILNNSQLSEWFWTNFYQKECPSKEIIQTLSSHELLVNLEKKIDYHFKNKELLIEAMSHRSFSHEVSQLESRSYERAEFIGDSFINYFVSKNLYQKLPHLKEGQWSKLRGAIVNTSSLCAISEYLDLKNVLLTGRGDVTNKTSLKQKIYADIFESLIGGIVLDSDEEYAWGVVSKIFQQFQDEKKIDFWSEELLQSFDYKSQLQEYIMQIFKTTPVYESDVADGGFMIRCLVNGENWGELKHESKKKGQKELAYKILLERKIINKD